MTGATGPADRVPEAEVALRFAFHLLGLADGPERVEVAVDGAQVAVGDCVVFDLRAFLVDEGWGPPSSDPKVWPGVYRRDNKLLHVHSRPGLGDVVGVVGGKRVRAECKKGRLRPAANGEEFRLLREALAQLLTIKQVGQDDVLVAVVPGENARYRRLAAEWRDRDLVRVAGLKIALVNRAGSVEGLDL